MSKRGGEDLKKLTGLQANLVRLCHAFTLRALLIHAPKPHHKTSLQKTSHDLQLSLVAFQRAQQVSAERQRTVVKGVKLAVDDDILT